MWSPYWPDCPRLRPSWELKTDEGSHVGRAGGTGRGPGGTMGGADHGWGFEGQRGDRRLMLGRAVVCQLCRCGVVGACGGIYNVGLWWAHGGAA